MRPLHWAGLAVVGLLLFAVVGAANAVVAVDRTALNPEYAIETVAEEDGYTVARNLTASRVSSRLNETTLGDRRVVDTADPETERAIREAIPRSYVKRETDDAVRSVYAYLTGRSSNLTVRANLSPLAETVSAALADRAIAGQTGQFAGTTTVRNTTVRVDDDTVERLRAGPESYESVRVGIAVDIVLNSTTPRQQLSLVGIEADDYSDREAARAAQRREPAIRSRLRETLAGTPAEVRVAGRTIDIAGAVRERRPAIRRDICERTRERLGASAPPRRVCDGDGSGHPENTPVDNLTAAAVQSQYVVLDGLLRPRYDYATFDADATAAERRVRAAVEALIRERTEPSGSVTVGLQDLGSQDRETLRRTRAVLKHVDTAIPVLGLLALALSGVVYLITRSVSSTARVVGVVVAVDGAVSYGTLAVVDAVYLSEIRRLAAEPGAAAPARISVALVDGVYTTLRAQSLVLLAVGVGLVLAVALARRAGPTDQVVSEE